MTTGNLTIQDNDTLDQYVSVGEAVFGFNFPILEADELKVSINQTLLTYGTDYTIDGLGEDGGGEIDLTLYGGTDPGDIVTIWQDMPIERLTGFTAGAATLLPQALNTEFAARLRVEQQLRREIRNSMRLPPDDPVSGQDMVLPSNSARAGKFLAFDALGQPFPAEALGTDAALRTDLAAVISGSEGSRLIGFRQTGAGAVARTVQSKLADIFDGADYGMVGDDFTDNSAAFQALLNAAAGKGTVTIRGAAGNYRFNSQIAIPSNTRLEIQAGAVLEMRTDDTPFLKGEGVSNVEIFGLGEVLGVQGSADWPSPTANAEGLIHFINDGATLCQNIRIHTIRVRRTWCPISCIRVLGLWVQNTSCSDFMRYGVLASKSTNFHIDHNNIEGSNVTAGNAYGIMATGDTAGSASQERCTITYNHVKDIPAWDGIMSHDCKKLTVHGNTCENVRSGIDLGHLDDTNVVEDLVVTDNTIELTTTDTWAGAAAAHFGIGIVGYDATHRVAGARVSGNTVRNHGNIVGATMSGNPGSIVILHADDVALGPNTITGASDDPQNFAGIFVGGTIKRLTINGGSIEGTMPSGGIRIDNVTADIVSINGVAILQGTASDGALVITGSTIDAFGQSGIVTNSTAPFSVGTSTITYKGPSSYRVVVNQAVANLNTVTSRQDAFAIAGVAAGDSVNVTLPAAWPAGLQCSPPIIGTNQVFLQLYNPTGGNLSMAANDFVFDVKLYR